MSTTDDVFGTDVREVASPRRRGRAVSYEPGQAAPHGYWVLWAGDRRPTWHPLDAVTLADPAPRPAAPTREPAAVSS